MINSICSIGQGFGASWAFSHALMLKKQADLERGRIDPSVKLRDQNLSQEQCFLDVTINSSVVVQGLIASSIFNKAFPSLNLASRTVVYFSSAMCILQILSSFGVISDKVGKTAFEMQNNLIMDSLNLGILTVSSIALIYFGHTAIGISSLLGLAIGLMNGRKLLPKSLSRFLEQYHLPIFYGSLFISGGFFTRLSVIIFCITHVLQIADEKNMTLRQYLASILAVN